MRIYFDVNRDRDGTIINTECLPYPYLNSTVLEIIEDGIYMYRGFYLATFYNGKLTTYYDDDDGEREITFGPNPWHSDLAKLKVIHV